MPSWLVMLIRTVWRVKDIVRKISALLDYLTATLPDPRKPSERNPMGGA